MIPGSAKSLYETNPTLHTRIGYRQLMSRMSCGRLGIGKGSKRVDVCDYCYTFDHYTMKKIIENLQEIRSMLEGLSPGFWLEHDAVVLTKGAFCVPGFKQAASVEFLELLVDYVRAHALPHELVAVRSFAADFLKDMVGELVGAVAPGDPDGACLLNDVRAMQSHWQLRDTQQERYREVLKNPPEDTLICHWDQQDRYKHTFLVLFGCKRCKR